MSDTVEVIEDVYSSNIPGAKVLVIGDSGAGKTHSIRTWLDAGIEPFVLFTEPGMEVVANVNEPGKACRMHWTYLPPATTDIDAMIESALRINSLAYDQLLRLSDINKRQFQEYVRFLQALKNFQCARCKKEFGPVSAWGTNRALNIDSLSGLSLMAMNLVIGSKPVKQQQDWGVSQDNLERGVLKLTTDYKCFVAIFAHPEREVDEVSGAVHIMASTLGRKLAPRLPRYFSDIIHAKREGTKFTWSTATANMVLKARNLPISDGLPPSFAALVEGWKKNGGVIEQ